MQDTDKYKELCDGLRIKLRSLDKCCAEQPSLMQDVSEQVSASMATATALKLQRDRVRAETSLSARADPDAHGLTKATESAIADVVVVDEKVRKAEDAYESALVEAKRWDGLLNAYEHRRSMLNNEVKLWSGDYFGDVDTEGGRAGRKAKLKNAKHSDTDEDE